MPNEVEQGLSEFAERAKWIKELEAPPGSVAGTIGGTSTTGEREWLEFRVEPATSSLEVIDHYTFQLNARGWEWQGQLTEGTVELRSFRFLDAESLPWHALLVVTESANVPERCLVSLQLTRSPRSELASASDALEVPSEGGSERHFAEPIDSEDEIWLRASRSPPMGLENSVQLAPLR